MPRCYLVYLVWLRHLLERLGRDNTLSIWQGVYQDYDDEMLFNILRAGWVVDAQDDGKDLEERTAALFSRYFPVSIEGVSRASARQLIENMPPINQIKQTFATPGVWKSMTAYEALHLRFDALALLAEMLLRLYGKQGELIAYDILHEERVITGGGRIGSVADFISDMITPPREATLLTAGLKMEIVHATEREVVLTVKECEWARYFQERHPRVGYLMACSTDEIAYRAFNKDLRMQRTSTIMEGGGLCDFRIYSVGDGTEER